MKYNWTIYNLNSEVKFLYAENILHLRIPSTLCNIFQSTFSVLLLIFKLFPFYIISTPLSFVKDIPGQVYNNTHSFCHLPLHSFTSVLFCNFKKPLTTLVQQLGLLIGWYQLFKLKLFYTIKVNMNFIQTYILISIVQTHLLHPLEDANFMVVTNKILPIYSIC